MEACYDLLVS